MRRPRTATLSPSTALFRAERGAFAGDRARGGVEPGAAVGAVPEREADRGGAVIGSVRARQRQRLTRRVGGVVGVGAEGCGGGSAGVLGGGVAFGGAAGLGGVPGGVVG